MERSKVTSGRGGKSKTPQFPADIFALGTKSNQNADNKRPANHTKSSSHSSSDRKREPGSSSLSSLGPNSKKPKVAAPTSLLVGARPPVTSNLSSGVGGNSGSLSSSNVIPSGVAAAGALVAGSGPQIEAWEANALEIDPPNLVPNILEAIHAHDSDRVVGLVTGAILHLRSHKWKPDPTVCVGLAYLARRSPGCFTNDTVTQAICSILRRDTQHNFKAKGNSQVPVLAANLLIRAYSEKKHWPIYFVKAYIDDALGERVWVDNEETQILCTNITEAISGKPIPRGALQPEAAFSLSARTDCSSPGVDTQAPDFEDKDKTSEAGVNSPAASASGGSDEIQKAEYPEMPRFIHIQDQVEQAVITAVKDQLNRRGGPAAPAENITRNFLKLLTCSCGIAEVRLVVSTRLELWLQNPKLMRPAQELLMAVCVNCLHDPSLSTVANTSDAECVSNIVRIRLKAKALHNFYISCIREMLAAHPVNMSLVVKYTLMNELSSSRNPNNLSILSVVFQNKPEEGAFTLADVTQEILLTREDLLRSLRVLFRRLHDVNWAAFCRGLAREEILINSPAFRDDEFKEKMFIAITDLITLSIFMCITPSVKEAAALLTRGDRRELATLQAFQFSVAKIQRDAIWWLHETVIKIYRPAPTEYFRSVHKVLLLDQTDLKDLWQTDMERSIMLKLASEVPILQNTLIRIAVIGLNKEFPFSAPDALEACDHVVRRAAALSIILDVNPQSSVFAPPLKVDKLELIDILFQLTTYRHPENIDLPNGYSPPLLAIGTYYWKCWLILLILCAHNPTTLGATAWSKYPTLRCLIEMCITNNFSFPPLSNGSPELLEELKAKETQTASIEKQQIIEFESYLAAASTRQTITEQTSLLLSQLILMDPPGLPRKPPIVVLDQLRVFNNTLRLGHLLCRSRNPDFLLEIIQRHGSSQSMPWLADLVDNCDGDLSHLPVQCLCEFLLSTGAVTVERQSKQRQLLTHLNELLTGPQSQDPQIACEVVEYFLRRLSSLQSRSRLQAIRGLRMVLAAAPLEDFDSALEIPIGEVGVDSVVDSLGASSVDHPESSWLLGQLPRISHFPTVRWQVVQALRQACQVENSPNLVSEYIIFLAEHSLADSNLVQLTSLVQDMSQLIVERTSIMAALLPSGGDPAHSPYATTHHALMCIFNCFLHKAREPGSEEYNWSESQEQVLVRWPSGEQCTLHILVVHAMVILLNYGPGQDLELFTTLLERWFPLDRNQVPKAYLVDTSEEALLVPDWLKLRMIRSDVDRLVDAALHDLEPPQLVLFIQSFGIPVKSTTKLLQKLDAAVRTDPAAVNEASMDKAYMAQLVEVQRNRGAVGGNLLVQALGLEQQVHPSKKVVLIPAERKKLFPSESVSPISRLPGSSNVMQISENLATLFSISSPEVKRAASHDITRALHTPMLQHFTYITCIEFLEAGVSPPAHIRIATSEPRYLCSILRSLYLYNSECIRLLSIVQSLLSLTAPNTHPQLSQICTEIICRHNKRTEPQQELTSSSVNELNMLAQFSLDAPNVTPNQRERFVGAVGHLLARNDSTPSLSDSSTGLLVDLLVSADPEMVVAGPSVQMLLLFGPPESAELAYTCRPLLLTLLVHHASWPTLYYCVRSLLKTPASLNQFDPSSVLDFLDAVQRGPKLWHCGPEVNPPPTSPRHVPDDVLGLEIDLLFSLIDYMVMEACKLYENNENEKVAERLERRLSLLLPALENYQQRSRLVRHLSTLAERSDATAARQLLLVLYLRVPGMVRYLDPVTTEKLYASAYLEERTSVLDLSSHCLITALCTLTPPPPTKDWPRRLAEYELSARKMAATHPILMLRQLPMIATQLEGRTLNSFSIFRSKHHLNVFSHVFGLLELMQPYIFDSVFEKSLTDVLSIYVTILWTYGYHKDLISIGGRFALILHSWLCHDAPSALRFLHKHAQELNDIQSHPNQEPMRNLLSGVALPRHGSSGSAVPGSSTGSGNFEEDSSNSELPSVTLATPATTSSNSAPIVDPLPTPHMLSTLNKSIGDDVVSVLHDLDQWSGRRPSVLGPCFEPLCRLLLSRSNSVRHSAHGLLARILRHDPRKAPLALPWFQRALSAQSDIEVQSAALERVPEMAVLCQENAQPLLQAVFDLSITSNVITLPVITKAIALLNLQNGY